MKRNRIAVLFILVSLCLASCNKLTNGEPTTEKRSVGSFSAISMHNNVNVKLIQDAHPRLELTCPKNLIEKVKTEVIDNTLYIKNENDFNWLRSFDYRIDLTVYYDSLRVVNYASNGNLTCTDTIKGYMIPSIDMTGGGNEPSRASTFHLNINEGSGDIDLTLECDMFKIHFTNGTSFVRLRGNAGYSELLTRSYGPIHAEELKSNYVVVQSDSSNDVYVWAKTGLRVELLSRGNIYYKGDDADNPIISIDTHTGSGKVSEIPK